MIKISVIIPTCDVTNPHIDISLQSVINQSLKDIEILVVCTNTPTKNGVSQPKDCLSRVIYIPSGELGDAYNLGVREARGEYLLFLDGGDVLSSNNALELLHDKAIKDCADIVAEGDPYTDTKTINGGLTSLIKTSQRLDYRGMATRIFTSWYRHKIYRRSFFLDMGLRFSASPDINENSFLRGFAPSACAISYVSSGVFAEQSAPVSPHRWFYYALTSLYSNLSQYAGYNGDEKRAFINFCIEFSMLHFEEIYEIEQREEALALLYKLDRKFKLRDFERVTKKDSEYYFKGDYVPWLYNAVKEHICTPQTPAVVDPSKEGISVIIPVYNVEEYVELALRSVMNQSYDGDIQIICINDGSTDNSLKVLQMLAKEDSRIEIIDQPNAGQGPARNAGLKVARHERIMFLDSDDFWELETFELVSSAFVYDTDLVIFSLRCFGERFKYGYRSNRDGLHLISDSLRRDLSVSMWNKVWRKSIFERYNMEFPAIKHEDVTFASFYFVVAKSAYFFSDKLFNYNQRSDSTMGVSRAKNSPYVADYLKSIETLYDNLVEHNIYGLGLAIFSKMFKMQTSFYLLHTKGSKQKEGVKSMQAMLKKYEQRESLRDYNFGGYLDKIERGDLHEYKLYKYYIFQLLHTLSIKEFSRTKYYLLFGVIPIYKIKIADKGNRRKHFLFGFLPIFKTKIASR